MLSAGRLFVAAANGRGKGFLPAAACLLALALLPLAPGAKAQESLCAQVKIEIRQELTLERQAFDAEMKISNGLDSAVLDNVSINVNFADEAGNSVRATTDAGDASALFFMRVDSLSGIDRIDGGRVAPATTAEIHWLIIPAPGAGGTTPIGKLYLVGATLSYRLAGEPQTVTVTPDSIYVKPLPKLTLDYFLQREVYADDPFTAAIEPAETFTLGVRVKNTGFAAARSLKIESAQPRIVENQQGLLVNFLITGSFVNDQPAQPSLLIHLGEIAAQKASTGRWLMQSTLSGRFIEFSASFEHADELGGRVTSLIDKVETHSLVKDVRVDLPGRDGVRDFLAKDGDALRVYETDSEDSPVTDQSALSTLTAGAASGDEIVVALNAPPTAGFFYVKLPDPYRGAKAVGRVTRSDGKVVAAENVWFSKTLKSTGTWDHFINFFDANTTGRYNVVLATPSDGPKPPVLQFIPDRTLKEGEQVAFIVEASDPDGGTPTLSAAPLPAGASFVDQGNGVAVFDWTPRIGQAGRYAIDYTASDGEAETTQIASLTVQPAQKPAGPDIPTILAPTLEARVQVLRPILMVAGPSPLDTATRYHFELYADASLTTLLAVGESEKTPDATTWKVPVDLLDNARYWWRARAFDGSSYSEWITGRFVVDVFNDAPSEPQPSWPRDGAEVDSATPTLSALNSLDADGDAVQMSFELYADAAGTQRLAGSGPKPVGVGGVTSWTVPDPLGSTAYFWRITATDTLGALTESPLLRFTVNPGNRAPTQPTITQPANGATAPPGSVVLEVGATDPDSEPVSYLFELDQVDSFNGPSRRRMSGGPSVTMSGLPENTRWYWRARASDGRADSPWITGNFLVSGSDDPPGSPVPKNLGPGSWTDAARPRLELAPIPDPEGSSVGYQFQVYSDAALASLVAEGNAPQASWLLPTMLVDGVTYYWRARAVDAAGQPSNWSAATSFVVDTDVRTSPTLLFSSPERMALVKGPAVTLGWDVRDAENNAKLSLYFDRDGSGADGEEIVKDLPLDPALPSGTHAWTLGALPPGAYHVYGVLNNGQRTTVSYAPGVLVVPAAAPRGTLSLKLTSNTKLGEAAMFDATFQISLASAPSAEVTVGLNATRQGEARLSPGTLTFTPANWSTPQTVTVKPLNDCILDGTVNFRVTARAVSTDLDYAGVGAPDLAYTNADNDMPTTTANLVACGVTIVSSRPVSPREVEYVMKMDLANLGNDLAGVQGTVTSSSVNTKIIEAGIVFGPVSQGAVVTSQDTFTMRQDRRFVFEPAKLQWALTPIP
jgi:hypothetical protein